MARGYQVTLTLKDGQNRETTHTITLAVSVNTIAAAQTAVDAYLVDLALATGLGIQKAELSVPLTVTPTTAQSQSNIDEGAKMSILTTDSKKWHYRIPGPIKDGSGDFLYITGGEVDTGDAAITGLFANYLSAGAFRLGDVAQQIMAASGGIVSGVLEKS
jgi:hypothetical protein